MANETLQAHDRYYMDGRMIILSCGGRLFKLPHWQTERFSPVLSRLTESDTDGMRGTSDDTAIPIDDFITRGEFVMFLDFFYRGIFRKIPADEWCKLLVISSKLDCKQLRTKVIDELAARKMKVSSVYRVELGNKYAVPQLLPQAYAELFVRENHLTMEEGERLGLEITVKVLKGRDRCKRNSWTSARDVSVTELVKEIFPPPT